MLRDYWTNSKFADWLRGTMKPNSLTLDEWDDWKIEAEKKHPYRYWLAEEGLDIMQKVVMFIPDTLYSIKYNLANRFVTKTHTLTSNLKRGNWHEFDTRLLHCLFDELVNFVEVEIAASNFRWDPETRKKFKAPFWSYGWFRSRSYRNVEAAMDYLNWARVLKYDESWGANPGDEKYGQLTDQAKGAQEILELYVWWTLGRPLRKDPHDESGWSEYCDRKRSDNDNLVWKGWESRTQEEKDEANEILNKLRLLEDKYDDEDEEMMIRLIKVRKYIWT